MRSLAPSLINKHPFQIWQSQKVTNLLVDFYLANYKLAGIAPALAKQYVLKVWSEKNIKDEEVLRKECDNMLLEIKNQMQRIKHRESDPLDILNLKKVKVFLDVGANKLSALNYVAKNYPQIEKFIAVDVIPQRGQFLYPKKSEYFKVSENTKNFPIKPTSVDLILVQYAFHHFKDVNDIKRYLDILRKLLKPSGKLVIMEESFTKKYNYKSIKLNNAKYNLKTSARLTKRFYNLSDEEKWQFIIANDWLINVNNPHMQWSGQYQTWENWKNLLKEQGFKLHSQHNLGLRTNGRLKQGVHVIGIFKKNL